jgi:hypothetical protein
MVKSFFFKLFFFTNSNKYLYNQLLRHYLKYVQNNVFIELLLINFIPKSQLKNKSFGNFFKNNVFIKQQDLWMDYIQLWRKTQEEYFLDYLFSKNPYHTIQKSNYLNYYLLQFKESLNSGSNGLNNINNLEYSLKYQYNLNLQLLNLFDKVSLLYEKTQYLQQKTMRGILYRWFYEIFYPWYSALSLTLLMWLFFFHEIILSFIDINCYSSIIFIIYLFFFYR